MKQNFIEDTNPRELKELLEQIRLRVAALPDFQRDFVWDPSATQKLIASIAQNFPAGSLLRIYNTQDLFARREFANAPKLDGAKPTFLVLDGQQRLTSLYQAFYGVGEHRYYLNLKDLLDNNDFEDCLEHYKKTDKKAQRYEQFEVQAKELILPLSVLMGQEDDFDDWKDKVVEQAMVREERTQLQKNLGTIKKEWIRTIENYEFPVVTLSGGTSAEAVCTIFETLNGTGVKLSVFELLAARFYPKQINLRDRWDKAKQKYSILAGFDKEKEDQPIGFDIDPYYVLQIISLAARSTPSCKRSDILNLTKKDIEEWWDRAVEGLAAGLDLLRANCGVLVPKWLPYNTLIIPLGAVLTRTSALSGPQTGVRQQKLIQWFWCSVLGQAYEKSPNSQASIDMAEILAWLDGGEPPDTVKRFSFDSQTLRDVTVRQRALYRGIIALVLRRDSRDFHTNQKLNGQLVREGEVDDHHIFPFAHLGRENIPERLRNCVLNRTLIDAKTNKRISDRAPSQYLKDIEEPWKEQPGEFDKMLQSHLLPTGADSPLRRDDFESFLQWRQEAIWKEIKSATGLQDKI